MELKELLCLLEERLVQHDNNRKEVQRHLQEICTKITGEADLLERNVIGKLQESFNEVEERVLSLVERLNDNDDEEEGEDENGSLIEKVKRELSSTMEYKIQHLNNTNKQSTGQKRFVRVISTSYRNTGTIRSQTISSRPVDDDDDDFGYLHSHHGKKDTKKENNFVNSYSLIITDSNNDCYIPGEPDIKEVIRRLQEHLGKIHESMTSAQNDLAEICAKRRNEAEELKKRISQEFEPYFDQEDSHIQEILNSLREKSDGEIVGKLITKAKLALLINQRYSLNETNNDGVCGCELIVTREASLKATGFEERKPTNVTSSLSDKGDILLSFTFFDDNEINLLKTIKSTFKATIKVWGESESDESARTTIVEYTPGEYQIRFLGSFLIPDTTCHLKMRIEFGDSTSEWSDNTVEITTPEFETCVWKQCPDFVYSDRKYSIHSFNPRVAIKTGDDEFSRRHGFHHNDDNKSFYSTITGNMSFPPNKVTSWNIKIMNSGDNDGHGIFVGVAPFDINQNNEEDNYNKCGWYFSCYNSTLWSGPPHNYSIIEYGPNKGKKWGKYIHTGDNIGVVIDTTKGDLSFVLNGVNLGVAYEGIPLDKPLVPCVILGNKDDSVEFSFSEIKESVDTSILVPSNVTTKSTACDSIIVTWDVVEGVPFYQIEVDGRKSLYVSTTNTIANRGFLENTEHSFRVRAVKENKVGLWSGVVKKRTQKKSFETSGWKECPGDVYGPCKYSVDKKNPRIATKVNDSHDTYYCITIGNTPLPLNKVTSWNIKILNSKKNDGEKICIGVAPSDINQHILMVYNCNKCGWYFDCYFSLSCSAPPRFEHDGKSYGPRKEKGKYVHTGDSVGVVMDTSSGELSYVVNGVNLGIAFKGIPLDKPLVPCVLLGNEGDSVELGTSATKETVDTSVPVPSNIKTKNTRWNSISITWDVVEGATSYHVEVDGNAQWEESTARVFTKRNLLPETVHSFRIRAEKENLVSEWSDILTVKTSRPPDFSGYVWKECPNDVKWEIKYTIDENNPRIVSKFTEGWSKRSTIIGDTPLPLNKVTSWGIKLLKSVFFDGKHVYVGVAPFDINQNNENNYYECGWYFYCDNSKLYAGPPHNYRWGKDYKSRNGNGEHVHKGDTVGVIVDTAKGELSFAVNEVNLGIAYEGIPLDKPLVPCAILSHSSDFVELIYYEYHYININIKL